MFYKFLVPIRCHSPRCRRSARRPPPRWAGILHSFSCSGVRPISGRVSGSGGPSCSPGAVIRLSPSFGQFATYSSGGDYQISADDSTGTSTHNTISHDDSRLNLPIHSNSTKPAGFGPYMRPTAPFVLPDPPGSEFAVERPLVTDFRLPTERV